MQFTLITLFLTSGIVSDATFESDVMGASDRSECAPAQEKPRSSCQSNGEASDLPEPQPVLTTWAINRVVYGLSQSPQEWARLVARGFLDDDLPVEHSGATSVGSASNMVLLAVFCIIPILNLGIPGRKVFVILLGILLFHMVPVSAGWVDDINITLSVRGLLDINLKFLLMCVGALVWALSRCRSENPPQQPLPDAPDPQGGEEEDDAPDDHADIERAFPPRFVHVSIPRTQTSPAHPYRSCGHCKGKMLITFPMCRDCLRYWGNRKPLDPEPRA